MHNRDDIGYSLPPMLKSPPPSNSPMDSNRSYRWTSMTASNNSKMLGTPVKEMKKPDTSWWSPSRGDTWRLNAPRGRTLDLVAAFDQCARQETLESPKYVYSSRFRRNSEPMQENEEKEIVNTNFIDDSMIDDHDGFEEHDIDIDADYYDPQLVKHQRSIHKHQELFEEKQPVDSMNAPVNHDSRFQSVSSSHTHRSSVDHVIGGSSGDGKLPVSTVAGFITSTPQVFRGYQDDAIKYFGEEASIRGSPRFSREQRRQTQTIVLPSFDSPASVRKLKSSMQSSPSQPKAPIPSTPSLVKSIATEFEKADFGFHRKVDPSQEIADLRKTAELDNFDENQNLVLDSAEEDMSHESVPRVSHQEMRPSIQMGVSAYKLKNLEIPKEAKEKEDLYSLPIKKFQKKTENFDFDQTDEKKALTPRGKNLRQSLPFSDIPEERTCDKIDEMFDFVEVPTGDFDDKTLERTIDGYAEIKSQASQPKKVGNYSSLSTNTYQELEFDKDNTPYVQQSEDDGTRFSGSFSPPQFTRSPTLVTPHAGQSVTEYRVSEKEGCARTEKVVVQKLLQPAALATSTPKGTFAWRNNYQSNAPEDSFVSSISNFSAADKMNDSRRQISKLIETIEKTRKHIQLAEISLIDAKRARMVVQELASQRVLLICRERLKLQLDEVRRLQALSVVRHPPPPINKHFKSAMVISNIAIHLNKNFNCRGSFAFIVALKCRTEIEATGVVTLLAHYQTRMHIIHFGEHMHFSNLPVDFVISMEVYMMRVPEYKPPEKTCASVLAAKFRNLLVPNTAHRRSKNNTLAANRTVLSMPGYQAPECDFKFCGKLTLDRDSAGDRQFYLDDVTYPLEGTVKLQSHCSSLPEAIDVEYRGFLYLFDERSPNGDSTWERYWAMLHRGVIFFWKNPIDEKNEKVPLSQIDLTKCTNQSIEEARNERSHEFHIELLIDQTPTLLEKRRVVLAAESSDHLASWLNAINDTLYVLRS